MDQWAAIQIGAISVLAVRGLKMSGGAIACQVDNKGSAIGAMIRALLRVRRLKYDLTLYLGSQSDSHNTAQLVDTSLQLLQSLHVLVEVQLLCHCLCLHCTSTAAAQSLLLSSTRYDALHPECPTV